jgi:hypothetical protein
MHPVTDPSMHGMGSTPSFLVEGSWVIGFFRDAQEKQQPVIIGSLPGVPSGPADYSTGFNDPRSPYTNQTEYAGAPTYGPYPVDGEEASMKSVFKTVGVDDDSLATDKKGTGVPTATQPYLKQVSDASVEETRGFWNEPHPKSITKNTEVYRSGQYPYNHVHESESGHIHEIDDSPGAERLFTQHTSGTFEEIHPTGTKVVKVIGDNYEIVAGASRVYLAGNVDLTVGGDVRELIKGDYHLEVEGNYTQKIHKNHRIKVGSGEGGGNREEEIRGNHAYQINGAVKGRITGNVDTIIEKSEVRLVNDTSSLSVQNAIKIVATGPTYSEAPYATSGDITIVANNNLSTTTISGITSFKSGDKLNMKSATAMDVKTEADGLTIYSEGLVTETFKASHTSVVTGTLDLDVSVEVDVDSALINLN